MLLVEVVLMDVVVVVVVVVVMTLAVGSGWLSSIDNKVTFPWEAAWRSRGRPLSRAAGPPPLREETTEGHQPERPSGLGPGPRPVWAAAGVWLVLAQPQWSGCCPPPP